MKTIAAHKEKKTIVEYEITPKHATRTESDEFKKNRQILIDRIGKCFICGTTINLQAHHYGCEWAFWNDCDKDKLKKFLLSFDIYGFSQFYRSTRTIDTPDDIRNLMLLCEKHHIEKEHGIHEMTFPMWIMQKIVDKRSVLFNE